MGEVGPSCISALLRMVLPGRRVSGHKSGVLPMGGGLPQLTGVPCSDCHPLCLADTGLL